MKLVSLSLCLCLLLTLLIGGIYMASQHQAPPNSIAQFHLTDCTPPCWIGIVPGQTTVGDAKNRIIATYGGQSGLQIKDSGFADGPVYMNAVENTIEGDAFSLLIRLNTSQLVDGRSEIVQSIGLFDTRADRSSDAPTVRDILSTFGAPQWFAEEETLGLGKEITLRYPGLDAVYYTRVNRLMLDEIPRFYLGSDPSDLPGTEFHPWRWFLTIGQS